MFGISRLKPLIAGLTLVSFLVLNSIPVYALPLSDISGHWARDSIVRLASLEIVNGNNGRFNPNGPVTRAEFAAMIVKALGFADQAQVVRGARTGYHDVPAGHWASGFVIVARELGIISGYPDNSFKPSARIRRDEITSVLVRALNLVATDDMQDVAETFGDGAEFPAWAAGAIKVASNYGLINGYPDGRFYPGRSATRGETAALVENVLRQLGAEYTFFGQIRTVVSTANLLTLDIHGQVETFPFRPDLEVIGGSGSRGTVADLKPGAGVFVIVDSEGYINLVEIAARDKQEGSRDLAVISGTATIDNTGKRTRADKPETGYLVVTKDGAAGKVSALVKALGGEVKFINNEINYIFAHIPAKSLGRLQASSLVEEVTPDRTVRVKALSTMAEQGEPAVNEANPGRSLNVTKEAIKAPAFVRLTQSDGKNQVIAVIDTGVDAGHPDLRTTSGGERKITEWRDFTGEGDIDTSSIMSPDGQNLTLANGSYYLGDISSVSGLIRYGYLREVDLVNADGSGYDLNFNGKTNDIFAVILVDSASPKIYDTVYIDTDRDKDFSDEKALREFSLSPDYASITGEEGRDELNLVLTHIEDDGDGINLGFDGNDHGTHVAGIAAANGTIKGVAPGARIMSLKVLDTAGYGDVSTIVEAMTYAASHGARIINLSLGFPVSDGSGGSLPAKLLNNLTEQYGAVFVVAAGNDGPGLSTVATPGDATGALSVGAFNTPEMWKEDYGWEVPDDNLWFFSSAGPRRDGAVSPSVIAPGSVTSTVPLRNGSRYFLSEGTSMAAPHVSGAIALLMEVAQRKGLQVSPYVIKRAVEAGANAIPHYTSAEQGYGAVNLPMSWAEILSLQNAPQVTVTTMNYDNNEGTGVYFREGTPQSLTLHLKNNASRPVSLKLDGGTWIKPGQSLVTIPSQMTRSVNVNLEVPAKKGLHAAFISGDDPSVYGKEMQILATVVNPFELNEGNNYSVSLEDSEGPAQYKRYYFKVPPGAKSLEVELTVPDRAGRSRVFLFNPKGQLVSETEFAGVNPAGAAAAVTASANYPAAGVWEAVVYSSAGLSAYNLQESDFVLRVSAREVDSGDLAQKSRDVIIGMIPKVIQAGRKGYITVQVRDRLTKRPFYGFVEINGKICFTRGGSVLLPVETGGDDLSFTVRTVPGAPVNKPWEITFTVPAGD